MLKPRCSWHRPRRALLRMPMPAILRLSGLLAGSLTAWAVLGPLPAAAQFNPFEALFGSPPRPPSSVPAGRPQVMPAEPPAQAADPYRPYPARQYPPDAAVDSEPLPPPPGGSAAAVEPPRGAQGPLAGVPSERPRGVPQRPENSPQSTEEPQAEPPSQKIVNKGAMFSGLDKITGRIISFDAGIGETVQFGALQVTPRVCYPRPPTESANTAAFIEVDEVPLQGDVKRIFTGW